MLVAALLLACVKTPVTGRKAFVLLSEKDELRLGADSYEEALKEEKVCADPGVQGAVSRIGRRIANVSGRRTWKWEFRVIDAGETLNAFALPGGKVAVYTGIFEPARTEAGLATVMGHEVAHAVARHGAERVSQGMLVQLGLTAASLSVGDSKNRDVIVGSLGAGAALGVLMPYGREMESEADEIGMVLMARAGYDPEEAVGFWERFQKATKNGGSPPEFLSTHPSTEHRIRDLKAVLPRARKEYRASKRVNGNDRLPAASCGAASDRPRIRAR